MVLFASHSKYIESSAVQVICDKEIFLIRIFSFDNQLENFLRTVFYVLNKARQLDESMM